MPNQPACVLCKYPDAQAYLDRRLSEGANYETIGTELRSPYRKKTLGYSKGPTNRAVKEHQLSHRGSAAVSANLPSFNGSTTSSSDETAVGDVATTIQREALRQLQAGEMRLTAAHALKAQEMLDKRAEKAADRELTVVLARLLTQQQAPPKSLIGGEEVIEGVAREVERLGTADD